MTDAKSVPIIFVSAEILMDRGFWKMLFFYKHKKAYHFDRPVIKMIGSDQKDEALQKARGNGLGLNALRLLIQFIFFNFPV